MAKRRQKRGSTRKASRPGSSAAAAIVLLVLVLGAGLWLFERTKTRPAGGFGPVAGGMEGRLPGVVSPMAEPSHAARPADASREATKQVADAARVDGAARVAPFGTSEEVFEGGARVYRQQCAGCHGRPGEAARSRGEGTRAGQFWQQGGAEPAKLAAEPVGQIYQAIAAGMPERAMPAYAGQLAEADLWKLALLLKNAKDELPDPVVRILRDGR